MIVIEPIAVTDSVLTSSNVLENDYAAYSAGTTYALGNRVISTTHKIYESLAASNLGNPLTDITKWLEVGATNRWKMFDSLNNTQTTNANSIDVVLSPALIANGIYMAGLDADSITLTITDAIDGVVYSKTESLIMPAGGTFWNWCFRRIRRRSVFVSLALPMYSNATYTVSISKPGGTAKCGMFVLGPQVDIGLSLYGLGTDIKDYSTTTFNADGTSTTVTRGFSKRMTIDVVIDNEDIDYVQDMLAGYRQTPVVWIGATTYGSTCIYGKFSSFKNVIESFPQSKMALQIEGMV